MPFPPPLRRTPAGPRWTVRWLCLAAVAILGGCSEEKVITLADYLDELEFDAPLEEVANVELGTYRIPLAAQTQSQASNEAGDGTVWMVLEFMLLAETAPEHQKSVEKALERHSGALHDAVLSICRTASVDEVLDPRLAALKSRLSDVTRMLLGDSRIRALVLNDIQTDFL
ncbi:MAG: hypothetical protein KDA61_01970 [Planctomycetales bacterium]|nr:hypothetical protein [Planctomycetales bacterium]